VDGDGKGSELLLISKLESAGIVRWVVAEGVRFEGERKKDLMRNEN